MPFIDANGVSLHYALAGRAWAFRRAAARARRHDEFVEQRRAAACRSAIACCATTSAAPGFRRRCGRNSPTTCWSRISRRSPRDLGLDPPYHFVTVAAAATQALRFLEKHPDQVGSLTLCNPAPGVDPSRAAALDERAAFAMREGMRASLPTTLDISYPKTLGDAAEYDAYRGRYLGNDPVGFGYGFRALARTNMLHMLPLVRLPRHGRRRPPRHRAPARRQRRAGEENSRRALRADRGRPLHADPGAGAAGRAARRFFTKTVARIERSEIRDQRRTPSLDFAAHPGYSENP